MICNLSECSRPVTHQAWITACFHCFCMQHKPDDLFGRTTAARPVAAGTDAEEAAEQRGICPAPQCTSAPMRHGHQGPGSSPGQRVGGHALSGRYAVACVDLDEPCDELVQLAMAGRSPSVALRMAERATAFW